MKVCGVKICAGGEGGTSVPSLQRGKGRLRWELLLSDHILGRFVVTGSLTGLKWFPGRAELAGSWDKLAPAGRALVPPQAHINIVSVLHWGCIVGISCEHSLA